MEGGRRAGNEEHFIYLLEQEGEYEEPLPGTSLSLSFYFKVIKLYLVPFLQIDKARRERKTSNPSAFLLFARPRVRSQEDFAKRSLNFLLQAREGHHASAPHRASAALNRARAIVSPFTASFSLVGSVGIE